MSEFSRFKTEYTVRPDDIDMFQHVHNSKYFDYVLAARYDQMRDFYGMTMEQFILDGYGWVVKTAFIDYKRPLKMGNKFIVETGIDTMHNKGCRVSFEIRFKENNKLSCDGWFDYILIDSQTGRSALINEEMIKKYSI
jgi:acyl-CoA thioester hydrolase/thioesterase-3